MARRRKPPDRLGRHTAPLHIFLTGVLTIIAFLFQTDLMVRAIQVFAFAGLATLAGKRIRWGYFAIMVASITFFNLLAPFGRIIAEIGPLRVTEGALRQGAFRALAIVGLVFISLFAVRPDLKLPGTFGGMLGRVFYYFECILETRRRVSAKRLVESIDEILMELYPPDSGLAVPVSGTDAGTGDDAGIGSDDVRGASRRTDLVGAAVMVVVVGANWALAIVSWPVAA